ncbi:MAG: hypothetical protein V3R93_07870 [Candidatus Hydrothermarchaeaceae archaeon]
MLETVIAIHILAWISISKKKGTNKKWEEVLDKVNRDLSLSDGGGVSGRK